MMNVRDEWEKQYIDTFGWFPFYYMSGMKDDIAIEIIRKAIESKQPIDPVYKKGCAY